jgi:hypothetical protein
VPADDKPFMRAEVAKIVEGSLDRLGLEFPAVDGARKEHLLSLRDRIL